jgi:hypothetical protein
MNTFIRVAISALAVAGASVASPANVLAGEALPPSVARQLDQMDAEFTMTDAKRRRLEFMQMQAARQQRHDRGGYGRGPGYGNRDGYGPRGYGRSSREWDRRW